MRAALGLLIFALAAGASIFVSVCACARKDRTAQAADCLIVLGAKVRPDGSMSDSLRYRCEAALQAWREGTAQYIIACGGQGTDEPAPEGGIMRDWFIENGVPEDQVFAENRSTNTIENFRNARKIMEDHGGQILYYERGSAQAPFIEKELAAFIRSVPFWRPGGGPVR